METRNIYKCFISSAGDCNNERESCQKVVDIINSGLAKHLNVNYETFMWEYDVLPDMGKNGQEIIDEYIAESNYDIFIGIMKNRFGHPTKRAGSGTEHEFNDALAKKLNDKNSLPKILFFFGKESLDPDDDLENAVEQYKKVKDFKKRIGDEGLYITFKNLNEFEEKLIHNLELFTKENSSISQPEKKIQEIDGIQKQLDLDLKNTLKAFNEDAPIWIEPIISKNNNISKDPSKNLEYQIAINDIIKNPKDIIIKAPAEFGLSCLGHYLKLEAWKQGKIFVYIDLKLTKKHKIIKDLQGIFKEKYDKDDSGIDCIIIDSVKFEESGTLKMIKTVIEEFPSIPLIILNTMGNNLLPTNNENVAISRNFNTYFLLALPQSEIRKIIDNYSSSKNIEEDIDVLLNKVTKDLDALNIHRTAKNCLAILKASSKIGLEYSPINRTKLLDTILHIIFEEYELPTYKSRKPDIKDCTFVLGFFVELLIKKNDFEFSEEYFKSELRKFCEENYIELDLNYLFQVLFDNSIFAKNYNVFYFKNSYWLFYFLSHRMNINDNFKDFIFNEKSYIDFPEIMEFYTGIDRNKKDALNILLDDIIVTTKEIQEKVNIGELDPYTKISWTPNLEDLENEEKKISEYVISSGLPDELKDKYNDKNYNQIKPYNQVLDKVMREYSFSVLMSQIKASSRALRNSDFVDSEIKIQLLNSIVLAWKEVTKLLIILSPILADTGNAHFEGAAFVLNEDDLSYESPEQKRFVVLLSIPQNIVNYFKDDIFSMKMGPLISAKAEKENNTILKHVLMRLIVFEKPKNWSQVIDKYIINLDKNSFYLLDISIALKSQFDYYVTDVNERRVIDNLMHKCRAKHFYNKNNPDLGLINKARKYS